MTIAAVLQKLRGKCNTHPHLRDRMRPSESALVIGNEWEEKCDRCGAHHDLLQTRLTSDSPQQLTCDYCK